MFSTKKYKYWLIALLIPMLAWAFLNRIWSGRFFLGADNSDFFYIFIYYFKNILHGVYPLWNPFRAWGALDYVDTQALGVCNPLCMIMPLLMSFGVKAYWAYASYIVVFWMMGFFGFYFLLNRIYNSPPIAWLGTSLLMFTAGLASFSSWDVAGLYIFAPLGWFFGFLIGFVRSSDDLALKRNMLGLCLSSMFIVHLYLPFYFLTIFFTFLVSVILFAGEWVMQFFGAVNRTLKRIPWAMLFCLMSFLFSLWPTVNCYMNMKDPQNISIFLRAENESKTGNAIVVSQQMIDIGGLPSRGTISELFSSYETGDGYLSFIPLILYILALLTLFNRSKRGQRVIFMTGFLLLLITITNVCPLQHFLYQHVYFFRLFRNYFFFWILFWSCGVVFVMGEVKQFLEGSLVSPKEKCLYALWVVLVHGGAIIYLMSLEDVPAVSFGTVLASGVWFLTRLINALRVRPGLFIVGLAFIGLWQPYYVLPLIRGVDSSRLNYVSNGPAFSYQRPLFGSGYNENDPRMGRVKIFKDESGFLANGYMGQKGSYLLGKNVSQANLANYVRYKFILYDQTGLIDEKNIDWDAVGRVVSFVEPTALIGERSGIVRSGGNGPEAPIILKGPSAAFKVIHFDVNSIELVIHLDRRKFLVYNDSYHPGWHVFIDHHPAKLYLANIAFKGVWIDKGSHLVRFCFGSWIDYLRGWGVPFLYVFWFFLVIAVFLPGSKRTS